MRRENARARANIR